MFSVAPNILLVPNMTQNANTERRTQTLLITGFVIKMYVIWATLLLSIGNSNVGLLVQTFRLEINFC